MWTKLAYHKWCVLGSHGGNPLNRFRALDESYRDGLGTTELYISTAILTMNSYIQNLEIKMNIKVDIIV